MLYIIRVLGGLFTSPERLLSCIVILCTGALFKVHTPV